MNNHGLTTRILGLDVGKKRVGVAFDNGTRGVAISALEPLSRSRNVALREVVKLVEQLDVELVVVGIPLSRDGLSLSEQALDCVRFGERLKKRISAKLCFIDESFSTQEARERFREISRRKEFVDSEAAVIVIERYLQSPEVAREF